MKMNKVKPSTYIFLTIIISIIVLLYWGETETFAYKWKWSNIAGYFAYYDSEKDIWRINLLLEGLFTTLRISIWSLFFSLFIGLMVSLMATSNVLFFQLVARFYVEIVRNMPPLVFFFIFYFFIGTQLFPVIGLDKVINSVASTPSTIYYIFFGNSRAIEGLLIGIVCLSLFEGAYFSEIFRSGISSVSSGQKEASKALGFNYVQQLFFIILPQTIRIVLPGILGQTITLIKDTSIFSVISVQELSFMTTETGVSNNQPLEVWIVAAVLYFIICTIVSVIGKLLERRFNKYGI